MFFVKLHDKIIIPNGYTFNLFNDLLFTLNPFYDIMPNFIRFQSLVFILLIFTACGNLSSKDPFKNCKYSKPEAIFKLPNDRILDHTFEVQGIEGIEEVVFTNQQSLTVIQSGCDYITQEFQIKLSGNLRNQEHTFWINQSIGFFQFLGGLGSQYLVFNAWSQAIHELKDQIQLGAFQEIQPGYFVKIDRILSSDHAILMLTLTEKP